MQLELIPKDDFPHTRNHGWSHVTNLILINFDSYSCISFKGLSPNVIKPIRSQSISVKISTHSSMLAAVMCLSRPYSAVLLNPLPQLSYIFDTIWMRPMVDKLCLIKYNAHIKYSRKSIVPHISCKVNKKRLVWPSEIIHINICFEFQCVSSEIPLNKKLTNRIKDSE